MSNNQVGITFSPYYFYTEFLGKLVSCYNESNGDNPVISYKLTDDMDPFMGKYRIDPISLPLLLSLSQQLKRNQNSAIRLDLSNYPATTKLLEFLYRSDFFFVWRETKRILIFHLERICCRMINDILVGSLMEISDRNIN